MGDPLIDICDLRIHFHTDEGVVRAVEDVDLTLRRQQTMGLVGESGCGKSVTTLAILRVIPDPPGRIVSGEILLHRENASPTDLVKLSPDSEDLRRIRGNEIAMIFQEPMSSLSPVYTVGAQIAEAVRLHQRVSKREARTRAIEMLQRVGVPAPERRVDEYPHQLSGGLRQRAMIAMALSCNPSLLIADEPTTALDVTTQAQILELMKELQEEFHMAILMITHDLGVIAEMADEVAVMYFGQVVEQAEVDALFHDPKHPYTRGLLQSMPTVGDAKERLAAIRGSVPSPFSVIEGCAFFDRCPQAQEPECRAPNGIALVEVADGHLVRCCQVEEGDSP